MKNRKPASPGFSMHTQASGPKTEPTLGREVRSKIGQQLRAVYDDVVSQGVPDRFRELLDRLEQQKKKE